ncbi:hypothetical protein IVA86_33215 [Bradyrhizobium sp. 146]|uniref:hypothetical protein n=1 Tax=Bradyrhizobium sp. 146 TaxID=2782622 RepID=UPI001FF84F22|nr:hypothetical protein [Bradyrhizobium sp. 146]MCK1706134.1 hypothetical protein [Bradyrhizobium sp. 146]
MAKRPPNDQGEVTTPTDFPAVVPRDLHPTTDIRFVIHELGKLTSQVVRLIEDVDSHGKKIGEVKDAINFVKGALWVLGAVVVVGGSILSLILSGKISVTFH